MSIVAGRVKDKNELNRTVFLLNAAAVGLLSLSNETVSFSQEGHSMSVTLTSRLVALTLAAVAATASVASAQTLGEALAEGRISPAAFQQLIADTGLSADEARGLTLNDIALIRTDSN